MKTFSSGQQIIVLLLIFGMTLLYLNSINVPNPSPIHPFTDSPAPKKLNGAQQLTLNKKININTATKTDLEAIRGIGPSTAEKIVDYRQRHGRFKRVDDLMNVKGIKEKGFEKIRRYLTVE